MDSVNPIKSDSELQGLLRRLDRIKKYKTFDRWKSKFLGRLESLVYEKGMPLADRSCTEFTKVLDGTIKCASKVTAFIEKGELSSEKKTVKASLALNELCQNHLTTTVDKLQRLIPSTGKEEKQVGFTKFHMGAALIRQGFHQYITMRQIEDAVEAIAEKVGDVADRQQLELFQNYGVRFQRFSDIMADLNLYDIMMKCIEFAEAPGEEESSDEEPMNIQIEVALADGTTKLVKLEVEPSDTIGQIKSLIAEDIGIDPDKQVIKFNGKELSDTNTVGKSGIQNGAKLPVETLKVPIIVNTYDGKQIKLLIDPSKDYLSDIKMLVETESGIPSQNQELFLNNEKLTNDSAKAADCGIKAGTILYMQPKLMNITAEMPDGTKHDVQVSPSDTAAQVKDKIASTTGMTAPTQILKFNGKEIPTGKTLKDVGVQDGDSFQVSASQLPITVKTKDGQIISILVAPTDTVQDIKQQLQDKTGVPANQQILCDENGKELVNDKQLVADCGGIKAGSTLTLSAKPLKISIELPDGSKHKIEIDGMDSASDIQDKIGKSKLADFVLTETKGSKLEIQTGKIFGKKL